jgi:hypothetical protein
VRAARHKASDDVLARLQVTGNGRAPGVVLGQYQDGRLFVLPLFQPVTRRIAVVGAARICQILALRAVAVGGRVVVFTDRPALWRPLLPAVGDPALLHIEPAAAHAAAAGRTLLIYDGDAARGGGGARPEPGPWQTEAHLVPDTTSAGLVAVRQSQAVIVQNLPQSAVNALGQVIPLTPEMLYGLATIHEETGVCIAPGADDSQFWARPTPVESHVLAASVRAASAQG